MFILVFSCSWIDHFGWLHSARGPLFDRVVAHYSIKSIYRDLSIKSIYRYIDLYSCLFTVVYTFTIKHVVHFIVNVLSLKKKR